VKLNRKPRSGAVQLGAVRGIVPFCFIGILPRFTARRFRLRAENAAPLTTLGRCAPANAASALTAARLAFRAAFAGWHPATGLRHAATSMSPLAQ